jgi:hypothetical protein
MIQQGLADPKLLKSAKKVKNPGLTIQGQELPPHDTWAELMMNEPVFTINALGLLLEPAHPPISRVHLGSALH